MWCVNDKCVTGYKRKVIKVMASKQILLLDLVAGSHDY